MDKEYLEKLLLDEGFRPFAGRAGAVGGSLRDSLSGNAAKPRPIERLYSVLTQLRSLRRLGNGHLLISGPKKSTFRVPTF